MNWFLSRQGREKVLILSPSQDWAVRNGIYPDYYSGQFYGGMMGMIRRFFWRRGFRWGPYKDRFPLTLKKIVPSSSNR